MTRTRPWTSSQEQTKTRSTQDWIIRGKTRRIGQNKATIKSGGRSPDAPDWNIPAGTSAPDRSIRGQAAGERHGLDHPGWIKQHEPAHPGPDHPRTKGGKMPRTGSSGVEQAAGATAPTTRKLRDTRWTDAPDWSICGRTGRIGHNHWGRGKIVSGPGQECLWRINQKGSPSPWLECPGESSGQRRRKQEVETKEAKRRRQDLKQRKEQGRGNAGRQRSGGGRGGAGQQS